MNWQRVFHVATYEFRTNLKRGGYLFATFGLPLVVILGLLVVQELTKHTSISSAVTGKGNKPIAVYDEALLFPKKASLPKPFTLVSDLAAAKEQARSGRYDALIVIPKDYPKTHEITVYTSSGGMVIEESIRRFYPLMIYAQLSPTFSLAEAQTLAEPPDVKLILLSEKSERSGTGRLFTGYALSIIFFMALFISTGYLLQSVAAEKENRMIEILLSSLSSMELLWGKVIGLAGLGILQMLVWLAGLWWVGTHTSLDVGGLHEAMTQLLHPDPQILLAAAIILPLGYITYGLLLAGLGSLGNNFRESQQFSAMVSLITTLPFMVSYIFFLNPNGLVPRVLSYFPFTAPVAVFLRLSIAPIPWWDFGITVVALVAGAIFSLWAGVRLFRVGVLMVGKKPSWKEVIKILRQPT